MQSIDNKRIAQRYELQRGAPNHNSYMSGCEIRERLWGVIRLEWCSQDFEILKSLLLGFEIVVAGYFVEVFESLWSTDNEKVAEIAHSFSSPDVK